MKKKGIPLRKQIRVTITPKVYEKMLSDRDNMIDNLFIQFHAIKNNKYTNILHLFENLLRERNEIDMQLALLKEQYEAVTKDNILCREITKHFNITKAP